MELLVATCAVIISVISLVATIFYSKKAQEHNVKSVLPIPYVDRSDFENLIRIRIFNKGTGPLIIKKIVALLPNGTTGHLIELIPDPPLDYTFNNFSKFSEDDWRTVPPGQSNDILICEFDVEDKVHSEFRKELRLFLKDVKLICDYTDVYHSTFKPYQAHCKWYGRHFEDSFNEKLKR